MLFFRHVLKSGFFHRAEIIDIDKTLFYPSQLSRQVCFIV